MSYDLRRISAFAIVFLVLLRISIGWQFLYEGLWKHQSQTTAEPWTSKGYLMNAQGPFRSFFRGMVDDPYDLNWLDHDHVKGRWETWQSNFAEHYQLSDEQKAKLDALLHGEKTFETPLDKLPEGINFDGSLGPLIAFDPAREVLYLKDPYAFKDAHWDRLLFKMPTRENPITEDDEPEYFQALNTLKKKVETPPYFKSLETMLRGNPELTGEPIKDEEGNIAEERVGQIAIYKSMLEKYDEEYAAAGRASDYDHLRTKWGKIQEMQSQLITPVKKLDADLKEDAYKILSAEQRQMPPVKPEPTRLSVIDKRVMWSLMILGGLLIAGCFTRVSALLGAGLVLSFYLANPPWPGVPPAPGPEHSFIVDKNLIEVIALLSLTCLPTGIWFGVDGIFHRLFSGEKREAPKRPAKTPEPPSANKPVPVKT